MNAAKHEPPVKAGDIIAGKYRVERILGVGGMGFVIAATHLDLQEIRALKFMIPSALPDGEGIERFLREARAASRLRSEHVTRVHDVGRLADGTLFMDMEYLEGTDLGAALKRSGVPPVEEAVIYILQVLDALAEAHAAGIVHRDLKPANIFLTHRRDGTPCVKILDFGISKVSGAMGGDFDVTKTHAVLGSPQYMSPEQMHSSRDVDARSDIWSLGVILYQLLTGQAPFRGRSLTELVATVMLSQINPPSYVAPHVSPELDAVVLRCLERDVNLRYANVGELAIGLRPFAVEGAGFLVDRITRTVAAGAPSSRASSHNLAMYAPPPDSQRSMSATPMPSSNPSNPSRPSQVSFAHLTMSAPGHTPPLHQQAPVPLPVLSASGAWGGTAAGSNFARPSRVRGTMIAAAAGAVVVVAIIALTLARSPDPVASASASNSITRVVSAVALAAARIPAVVDAGNVDTEPEVAPSVATPEPKAPKKPATRLGDPFGMDRK